MVVNVDNLGAIYITQNAGSSVCTCHVDIDIHFVREFHEDGVLLVRFINIKLNTAEVLTKNTDATTFKCHQPKFLWIPTIHH